MTPRNGTRPVGVTSYILSGQMKKRAHAHKQSLPDVWPQDESAQSVMNVRLSAIYLSVLLALPLCTPPPAGDNNGAEPQIDTTRVIKTEQGYVAALAGALRYFGRDSLDCDSLYKAGRAAWVRYAYGDTSAPAPRQTEWPRSAQMPPLPAAKAAWLTALHLRRVPAFTAPALDGEALYAAADCKGVVFIEFDDCYLWIKHIRLRKKRADMTLSDGRKVRIGRHESVGAFADGKFRDVISLMPGDSAGCIFYARSAGQTSVRARFYEPLLNRYAEILRGEDAAGHAALQLRKNPCDKAFRHGTVK